MRVKTVFTNFCCTCEILVCFTLWSEHFTYPHMQSEGVTAVALPLGDDEKFDWTPPHQRRRSLSPEVVPNLFRPRKESLVDVDFDHDRAASGKTQHSWYTCVLQLL